jgi:F-type H+-transporting ATPase subunit b
MLSAISVIAAEGGNGKWLPHDLKEVYWGTIAFLIIFGLLWWKAGPPIKRAMAGRTERIKDDIQAASDDKESAEAERDRIKTALADSDTEAARIVEEARQTADKLRHDLEAKANADAESIKARGAADLETTRRQAVADLTAEVSRLALGAAERVVSHNLDDAAQQQLIEQYINQVGSSN